MGKSRSGKRKKKTPSEEERGPAPFSQFTKTASGLLRKGYNYDRMLSISTKRFSVLNVTTTIHDGRLASVGFGTKLNSGNAALDLNNSFTSAALSYNGKLLPSANVSALLNFPDYKNSRVSTTLMYRGKHLLPCQMMALTRADKGDHYRVSCLHYFDRSMKTAASAEIATKLSDKTHTFAVGGSCMIDHLKLKMKAKVDNQGKIEALIQHKIKHKSSLTICCEYDIRTPYKMPRIGIVAGLIL